MKNLSKQVVILDNISSPYIHQAIIILKKYSPQQHEKIIEEAENVVFEYLNKTPGSIPKKTNSNFNLKCAVIVLSIALFISAVVNFI